MNGTNSIAESEKIVITSPIRVSLTASPFALAGRAADVTFDPSVAQKLMRATVTSWAS